MSYIESRAKQYASHNLNDFDKIIKEYEIDTTLRYNKEYCDTLHNKYKQICKFDNIIQVSYLFENDKDYYYKLKYGMSIINNRTEFKNLFLNDLSNTPKTLTSFVCSLRSQYYIIYCVKYNKTLYQR